MGKKFGAISYIHTSYEHFVYHGQFHLTAQIKLRSAKLHSTVGMFYFYACTHFIYTELNKISLEWTDTHTQNTFQFYCVIQILQKRLIKRYGHRTLGVQPNLYLWGPRLRNSTCPRRCQSAGRWKETKGKEGLDKIKTTAPNVQVSFDQIHHGRLASIKQGWVK